MDKLILGLLFSVSFLLAPCVFAQNVDQSSSDSGVLVSPPNHEAEPDQDEQNTEDMNSANASNSSGEENTNNPEHHQHHHKDDGGSQPSQDSGSN